MVWFIVIVIVIIGIILKMNSTSSNNEDKHSPEEIVEIAEFELKFRSEFAKNKMLLKIGKITDRQSMEWSKNLLEEHNEIQRKYDITEAEMSAYYELVYSKSSVYHN
ncbi:MULTISPECIES: hypothetical protein [Bacillaceae]|uniref:Uncharacterized protein n=1 Tax=Gottfriedia luciferensis TaxID=178774 RepID=A0ABX2ZRW2_9BACI|nr:MULTISPECIES: hypothetical protein [Bacillaceae]ODG92511.1 hypothetical protein BED47_18895 [Gottfriedia luciferensis]PGZ93006.1 hypothetical protein COE53_07785 [Bacillus sp. AFS029533]SFD39094.1 hypothetical protein SAMN02799633_03687 [Bacillus sp. UNCCL81]